VGDFGRKPLNRASVDIRKRDQCSDATHPTGREAGSRARVDIYIHASPVARSSEDGRSTVPV